MRANIERRAFLHAGGLVLGGAVVSSLLGRAPAAAPAARMRKGVTWSMIDPKLSVEDRFRLAKDVGFDGVEVSTRSTKSPETAPAVLARASEKVGLPIHGVSNGSTPEIVAAIDDAVVYGADTVLQVVPVDAATPFRGQYRSSQELIRSAIPHAEKRRVKILIENVWATFLIEPLTMARYIDELASPWVGAYFDVGNVMRWGYPQHWIEVLGSRIAKIHIKEYNLKTGMKEGMSKGFDTPIGEGDIDWGRVRNELRAIGFVDGWATAEVRGGDRARLADIVAQMDRVLHP